MKLGTKKTKFGGLLVACLMAAGMITGAPVARAADAINIGVLDETRLGEGYTKYRTAMDDLTRRAEASDIQIIARRFLDAAQGKRFDELAQTKARTEKEESEFQAIVKSGGERAKQYSELMGTPTKTPQQTADFTKWQEYQKDNALAAEKMDIEAFQYLKTQQQSTDKLYIENANAMVQKVAVDKKLTVLLRKDAIIWSTPTVDITDEVLRRLNDQKN